MDDDSNAETQLVRKASTSRICSSAPVTSLKEREMQANRLLWDEMSISQRSAGDSQNWGWNAKIPRLWWWKGILFGWEISLAVALLVVYPASHFFSSSLTCGLRLACHTFRMLLLVRDAWHSLDCTQELELSGKGRGRPLILYQERKFAPWNKQRFRTQSSEFVLPTWESV